MIRKDQFLIPYSRGSAKKNPYLPEYSGIFLWPNTAIDERSEGRADVGQTQRFPKKTSEAKFDWKKPTVEDELPFD